MLAEGARRQSGGTIRQRPSYALHLTSRTHEQDVRGALGLRGVREDERVQWPARQMMATLSKRFEDAGTGALRLGDTVLGVGAPAAQLTISDSELLRIVLGRRS